MEGDVGVISAVLSPSLQIVVGMLTDVRSSKGLALSSCGISGLFDHT